MMDGLGRHQPDTTMAMLAVVPGKERAAETSGVLDAPEARRKARTVVTCLGSVDRFRSGERLPNGILVSLHERDDRRL